MVLLRILLTLSIVYAVSGQNCKSLQDAIQNIPGHEIFPKVLTAVNFEFDPEKTYTVFLPSDGTPDGDSAKSFDALFTAFGIDTTSVETISASEFIGQLTGFLEYYIVPGAYSAAELKKRGEDEHLKTMFDTDGITCGVAEGAAGTKASDGDLQFATDSQGRLTVTDDAGVGGRTPTAAVIYDEDRPTCEGSYVHLLEGLLDPCCTPEETCEAVPLEAKQLDNTATTAVETSGTTSLSWALSVAAAGGLLVAFW